MSDVTEKALGFEAVKIGITQNKDGFVLRLAIHPNDAPERLLRDFVGARYQCAMVLLADDGQPAEREEDVRGKRLVTSAAMLCQETDFQAYAYEMFPVMDSISEANAATYIKASCKIESRAELATNAGAAAIFRDIRLAFDSWLTHRR